MEQAPTLALLFNFHRNKHLCKFSIIPFNTSILPFGCTVLKITSAFNTPPHFLVRNRPATSCLHCSPSDLPTKVSEKTYIVLYPNEVHQRLRFTTPAFSPPQLALNFFYCENFMKPINYNKHRSTEGFNERARFLVFHYTAANFASSVAALTGPNVSAHYLVPDITDPSYLSAGYTEQEVFGIVDEDKRAWHAGVSTWGNRQNLNDTSIGVEIVNLATDNQGKFNFPPYHPQQISAVEELALNILARYPDITPVNVVGHADIAIGRKSDPGPMFPWHALYLKGIGAWFDCDRQAAYSQQYTVSGIPCRTTLLKLFKTYGYDISAATTEPGFQRLVRAFQLHFRAHNYDGVMDVETAANLAALVNKYFP
jgi:N-acetylmuramoyl-L-alanine amidase